MEIKQILHNKKQYMELLFLADEQEDMIDRYLDTGDMFVVLDPKAVAECVVCDLGKGVFEIKNIAVLPEKQGKGYGRLLIEFVMEHYKGRCDKMLVGTGDSPLTVPFYKKCNKNDELCKYFFKILCYYIIKRKNRIQDFKRSS